MFVSRVGFFIYRSFDRSWFLIDKDFCKPGVTQDLSLNFNLIFEIFFRGE